ncbi:MAG: serine/threonine protein kinase [Myxococcaceae bacterium]|nr:serine/threonine protein kinase [Myxococcaceae bacterium]
MSSPDSNEAPPSVGLVGGKYELVKMIGRGGMGSVWEARHVSLGTPSAIKFIEAEYANSAEARSRFDKEAKAAATIQSKHAIQIYDHGVTDDGKPYIVMELLTGEPLDKRIERLGQLTLQDTAKILQQVSRGLARAHERGIVHRDLKPENIFIVRNTDDDEEVAKVLDFGIAKIQNSPHSPGITSSTKTGAVLGTPFYMSPEQARGLRNVDHRTDVWSLGVIAFKCITGRLPFDGESVGDLLVKICTAPIPIPSHSVPGLPQAFDTWFMRALEREPERRFSNVTELSEHLAFAAGIGASGRGTTPTPHMGPPMSATIAASSSGGNGMHGSSGHPGQHRGSMAGADANAQSYGSRTPNPAGMTAAPFTSSQPVPGVGSSKWKWLVGAAAIGLALAGIGTAVTVAVRRQRDAAATNSVGIVTQPPAASDKSGPPPSANDPVGAAGAGAASTNAGTNGAGTNDATPPTNSSATITETPLATGGKVPSHTKLGAKAPAAAGGKTAVGAGAGVGAAPAGAPLPPPGGAAVVAAPLPPPTPPPAPPPTVKKPNKNDPGY